MPQVTYRQGSVSVGAHCGTAKMSAVKSNLNGLVIEILSIYQKQTVQSVNSLLFSDSLRDEKTIMS